MDNIVADRKARAHAKRVRKGLSIEPPPGWDDARAKRKQIARAKALARAEIEEERREAIKKRRPGAHFIGGGK